MSNNKRIIEKMKDKGRDGIGKPILSKRYDDPPEA
jgi:hypothetical protein